MWFNEIMNNLLNNIFQCFRASAQYVIDGINSGNDLQVVFIFIKDMFLRSFLKLLGNIFPLNLSILSSNVEDNEEVKIAWQPSLLGFVLVKLRTWRPPSQIY